MKRKIVFLLILLLLLGIAIGFVIGSCSEDVRKSANHRENIQQTEIT